MSRAGMVRRRRQTGPGSGSIVGDVVEFRHRQGPVEDGPAVPAGKCCLGRCRTDRTQRKARRSRLSPAAPSPRSYGCQLIEARSSRTARDGEVARRAGDRPAGVALRAGEVWAPPPRRSAAGGSGCSSSWSPSISRWKMWLLLTPKPAPRSRRQGDAVHAHPGRGSCLDRPGEARDGGVGRRAGIGASAGKHWQSSDITWRSGARSESPRPPSAGRPRSTARPPAAGSRLRGRGIEVGEVRTDVDRALATGRGPARPLGAPRRAAAPP